MITADVINIVVHSATQDDIIHQYRTDEIKGLSPDESTRRLDKFGQNTIIHEKRESLWMILIRQFNSPIVYLLIFAAGLSFVFQEFLDAFAILVVIMINAMIGFYMEYEAKRSMYNTPEQVWLQRTQKGDATIRPLGCKANNAIVAGCAYTC